MTATTADPIQSVPEFLAHAIELEHDSADHYRQLALAMDVHHNPKVARLFRRFADMSEAHASNTSAHAEGLLLPDIAPWAFKWECPMSPEGDCGESMVNYLMTPLQAIEVALLNEIRGRDFYAQVARTSPDPRVRVLAGDMAAEEHAHVQMLKDWYAQESAREQPVADDLDPPNLPG